MWLSIIKYTYYNILFLRCGDAFHPPTWFLCVTSLNQLALVVIIITDSTTIITIITIILITLTIIILGDQCLNQLPDILLPWKEVQESAHQICDSLHLVSTKHEISNGVKFFAVRGFIVVPIFHIFAHNW